MAKTTLDERQGEMFTPEDWSDLDPSSWTPPDLNALSLVQRADIISVDVETCDPSIAAGKGPGVRRGGYICGYGVGIGRDGPRLYYPVRHQGGGNLDPDVTFNALRSELNKFTGDVVGHELLYDLDYSAAEGIDFRNTRRFFDTGVMDSLLDENQFTYNLNAVAARRLNESKTEDDLVKAARAYGFITGKSDPARQARANIWRMPAAYAGTYAEGDVDLPIRLYDAMLPMLEKEELIGPHELESDLIPLLLAMRQRGVRVDLDRAHRNIEECHRRRDLARKKLHEATRIADCEWQPEILGPALEAEGVKVPRHSRGFSITKDWLAAQDSHPLIDAIRDARRWDRCATTFLEGYVIGHEVDGRINCVFHSAKSDLGGTVSGRFACSNPNLQNLPARDPEIQQMVRTCFLPEDGCEWAALDYSQIEFRLLVEYAVGAGAAEARKEYITNPDTSFHKLAAYIAGMDPEDKPTYKKVKNVNFCKVYGGGPERVAETAGIPLDEAIAFVNEYDQRLPFVRATNKKAERIARQRGWVRSLGGRLHRIDDPNHAYRALNRLLQGGAAEVMKKAMVDIWKSGVNEVLGVAHVTVHDELGMSKPGTKEGDEAIAEAKRLMEVVFKTRVPIVADLELGPNWGDVK